MLVLTENMLLLLILVFSWVEYLWELYLSLRQMKVYMTKSPIPAPLKKMLTEETFEKARLYGIDKTKYRIVKEFYSITFTSIVLYRQWMFSAWDISCNIAIFLNISDDNEVAISCIFIPFITVFSFVINMPFIIYSVFVLEEKHGFNKQTLPFFIKDQIKSLVLSLVISMPVIAAIVKIVMVGGNMFIIWMWLFTTVVTLLLLALYPTVIAPMFDKFVPLPEGELRTGIEGLASKLNFPLSQVFIVEGSKRSAHSNAYFAGLFGAKRIVLFDTLLEKYDEKKKQTTGCNNSEILSVLAHELGHWKCSHIYKHIILTEINLLLLFTAFALLFKHPLLYTTLGFPPGSQPVIIGLIVILQLILAPYNSLLMFFVTVMTRKFEFQADDFAVMLNYPNELKSSLVKLGKDNLDYPIYDNLYSAWHHSHPSVLERIENIDKKAALKRD